MTNQITHCCPSCGYDLTYLRHDVELTCPECGGRCLNIEARDATRPGRCIGTIADVFMFLFIGPPIVGAGLFMVGLVMVFSTGEGVIPLVFAALSPLMLLWYVVSMSRRLWPRYGALGQSEREQTTLRTLIALSIPINIGWALAMGYMLLMFAGLARM